MSVGEAVVEGEVRGELSDALNLLQEERSDERVACRGPGIAQHRVPVHQEGLDVVRDEAAIEQVLQVEGLDAQ